MTNDSYYQKYVKYKIRYLKKKQIGGNFDEYPIIKSRSADEKFEGGGARGDGLCSIWAVLIGFSLLNRDSFIKNHHFYDGPTLTTMPDLIAMLIHVSKLLLSMFDDSIPTLEIEHFEFTRNELDALIFQMEIYQDLNVIEGRAHFQIFAMLLGVEIQVLDTITGLIDIIGDSSNSTIRISTNGVHYDVHNNKKSDNLEHFTNRYWWNLQWKNHPHLEEGYETFIAFIS